MSDKEYRVSILDDVMIFVKELAIEFLMVIFASLVMAGGLLGLVQIIKYFAGE
jgi:hypothetical protein